MRVSVMEVDGERRLYAKAGPERPWAPTDATDVLDLLRGDEPTRRLAAATDAPAADPPPADAPALAPVDAPGKLLFVGVNYRDHVAEIGAEPPREPVIFAKLPSAIVGPGDPIVLPPGGESRVDYEGELAIVVGRRAKGLSVESALDHVFGYTILNDVSDRGVQFDDGQLTLGKGADTFCPIGPEVVLADEIPDPGKLEIATRVNGELRQSASTASMIFPVPVLLAYVSRLVTLEPGDVVSTGTPAGCGAFAEPPAYLQAGDSVSVAIEGIGELANPVVVSPVSAA